MAGDLIIDKVAASSTATKTSLMRGLAKAWANLNGTGTIALRNSLNIASVTDAGTGQYAFNLTASLSANDGAHGGFTDGNEADFASSRIAHGSASSVRFLSLVITGGVAGFVDTTGAKISVHGDLA